jgi:class 3 adenylate cyclase
MRSWTCKVASCGSLSISEPGLTAIQGPRQTNPLVAYHVLRQAGGGCALTTENVAILFTDIVGSTELSQRLSAQAADEVRREHFSALRQAIAETGGIEVKSLGDGLMVAFPVASAALSCAVAMQQAVARDNIRMGHHLQLRVGLSAGEVTREADDYFGDPVIEAARLCARANGDQILVANLVRAMAGRRSPHSFTSLGPSELKGLSDAVETLELGWEPPPDSDGVASPVPLPPLLERGPATGVVGRELQSVLLADAYKRASTDEGREVVLVSGEAGAGKSTLAAQLARAAFAEGAFVLLGRCEEDLPAPYGPFVEALSHFVTHATSDVLRAHVERHGGELATMVPALARRLGALPAAQSADPDTERYLLYGAVLGLLVQACEGQPVVLVLEDLQWADKATLQLLRHLVAHTTALRLLLVGTHRDSELSSTTPLTEALAAWHREVGVSRVRLSGLDDLGVLAFMEAAAGDDLGDAGVALAHALYRETDGNPFFVGEVLRHLAETGAIYRDHAGRWTTATDLADLSLPDSVRQVIESRVARLGDSAGHVLALASVIGREFDLDLLIRVTERSEDELLDILDAATNAALLSEVADASARYSFAHALIQHALYQGLGTTRRARAHRRIAETIEAMCGPDVGPRVGELARHWFSASQPMDASKAVTYARQAGEAALEGLAPDAAVRYYSDALQLVELTPGDDPLLECDLRIELGKAQRQAGIGAFRETLLDAAHRAQVLGATDRLVQAALANSRGWSSSGVIDAKKVAVLEAALEAVDDDDSRERALLLATLCNELTYLSPMERRRALADAARAMARRLGDAVTLLQVLILVANPLQFPSALEERLADTREALGLAESIGDPELLYRASSHGQINGVQSGDFALVDRCMESMRTLSERLRQPTLMWMTAFKEAAQALIVGEADRAEQLAGVAHQMGVGSGQPDTSVLYQGQLIVARYEQGRLGELVSLIDERVAGGTSTPGMRAVLAAAHLEAGNDATALDQLQSAAGDEFAWLPLAFQWTIVTAFYGAVAAELSAAGPAQILYDLLAPYHAQIPFDGSTVMFPVASTLGALASVLGRYDEAEGHFAEANELMTRGDMQFFAAATDLWWGRMFAERGAPGDTEKARDLLSQAHAAAKAHRYGGVERRAATVLEGLG